LVGIAMPLKYMYHKPEAVKVVGMAHGVLFILYVVFVLAVAYQFRWSIIKTGLGLLAAFIPFGTFWAEFKLFRNDTFMK
jgi:integral membrane protein